MPNLKHTTIPDEHHVVRRCGFQTIERDSVTNQIVGLYPRLMQLRVGLDEKYLSVNLLEHCPGSRNDRLRAVVAIHRAKAQSKLSPNSGVAIVSAERIREIGAGHKRTLTVRHTPNKRDISYSRVSGLPLDNSEEHLSAALAEEAFQDFMTLEQVDALP